MLVNRLTATEMQALAEFFDALGHGGNNYAGTGSRGSRDELVSMSITREQAVQLAVALRYDCAGSLKIRADLEAIKAHASGRRKPADAKGTAAKAAALP